MTAARTGTEPVSRPSTRRRFVLAVGVAGVLALVLFAVVLSAGSSDPLTTEPFGADFYDAQAKALMHGRWDVPRRVAGVDGFEVGGKFYIYFGIWPSVVRMPVLLFSDSLTGQLS